MGYKGKVYIIGCGPGHPELLTVKAFGLIKLADVAFYDGLVAEEVLELLPADCERYYVGKRYGDQVDQKARQDSINQQLLKSAGEGKTVLRLKSGDPLIFGRGYEELTYLSNEGVEVELVPGLTAGLSTAALKQIPLTERNVSHEVLLCTGQTALGSADGLESLVQRLLNGTVLVMYMGYKRLPEILDRFLQHKKVALLNVTAVSRATYNDEIVLNTTLDRAKEIIVGAELPLPVVLFIGANTKPFV